MKFNIVRLILALIFILPTVLQSQSFEKKRFISKSFKVYDDMEVQLINKYGNIHMITWDKDSVKFEINMKVVSNKQSRLDGTFDFIEFKFTDTKYFVIAETVFQAEKNSFWEDVSDFANILLKYNTSVQIDYTLYIPSDNDLKINNKFGNIYFSDFNGNLDVELSNGDIKAHNLDKAATINLKFGNCKLNRINEGKIELSYSDFRTKTATNLKILSKSSTVSIDKINKIEINSKRDKYYIGNANSIHGKAYFSYLNFDIFNENVFLNTSYGDLTIENSNSLFDMFELNASYTDITLTIPKNIDCYFEYYFNEKTTFRLPHAFDSFEKVRIRGREDEDFLIKGNITEKDQAKSKIIIKQNSGFLLIQQN